MDEESMLSETDNTKNFIPSLLISLGLSICLLALFTKSLSFWNLDNTIEISSRTVLGIGALITALGLIINKIFLLQYRFEPLGFVIGLWILFFSDWLCRPFNFLQGPSIRGEIILFSIAGYFIIRKKNFALFNYALIAAVIICISCFFAASAGRLLFSDDHTVFLYRLSLLKQHFPFIPFYDPFWNGGIDARDFFATGSLNVFFIFSPLIYSFPIEQIYNIIVIGVLFILTPSMMYFTAKTGGLKSPAPAIAAILSFCSSLFWYRWGLQYGTLGFLTSLSLIPFNLVVATRILDYDKTLSKKLILLFVATFSLMLFWSPSGLVFVPSVLVALFRIKSLIKNPLILKLVLVLTILNLPWMIAFWSVSNVSGFIVKGHSTHQVSMSVQGAEEVKLQKGPDYYFKKGVKALQEGALSTNPLLLIFGLIGLIQMPKNRQRLFLPTALWLILLGTFISPLNPRLELERMLVILGSILCIPAGLSISKLYQETDLERTSPLRYALLSLSAGFILISPLCAASLILNRGLVQYSYADEVVNGVSSAIKQYANNSRILFSGFSLHELSGGHLAPLAYFTKNPLMASSHVHNQWKYQQIIPANFMKREDAGIQEYFDLYNVGAVFSHEKYWHDYFDARPLLYTKVWQGGKFILYTRNNYISNYFHEGIGDNLSMNSNSLSFIAKSPHIILKFNYYPFLQSSACKIGAKKVSEEINLIELTDCPNEAQVVISSKNLFKRLLN